MRGKLERLLPLYDQEILQWNMKMTYRELMSFWEKKGVAVRSMRRFLIYPSRCYLQTDV